jgi:hypothetical protein
VICVNASDDDDAVRKIIKAGGMACRNRESRQLCMTPHLTMPFLPDGQLKDLVQSMIKQKVLPAASDYADLEARVEKGIFQNIKESQHF